MQEATANAISYPCSLDSFKANPISNAATIPPSVLIVVANPVTDATTFLGNRSEITVKIFADQEQCAAAATAINATLINCED